ncbi:hypothetical protein Hanom_Chr03g00184621 [Helianthus anomalus]
MSSNTVWITPCLQFFNFTLPPKSPRLLKSNALLINIQFSTIAPLDEPGTSHVA